LFFVDQLTGFGFGVFFRHILIFFHHYKFFIVVKIYKYILKIFKFQGLFLFPHFSSKETSFLELKITTLPLFFPA